MTMNKESLLPILMFEAKRQAIFLSPVKQRDWIDDLISAGYLGIVKGSKNFSPKNGASPQTYITYRIKGEIRDEIRNMIFHKRRKEAPYVLSLDAILEERSQEKDKEDILYRKEAFPPGLKAESPLFEECLFKETVSNFAFLRPRESLIMRLYYLNDLTMTEIAKRLCITESRVSQVHSKAVKSLQTLLKTAP